MATGILLSSALIGLAEHKLKWKGNSGNIADLANWDIIVDPEVPTGEGNKDVVFAEAEGEQTVELDDLGFVVGSVEFGSGRPEYSFKKTADAITDPKFKLTGNVKALAGAAVTFEDVALELTGVHEVDVEADTTLSFVGGVVGSNGIGQMKKLGAGTLKLGGDDGDFSGGIELIAGSLLLTSSSTNINGIKGPAGSGTLTLGNDTTLAPDTDITLDNAIVLSGGRAMVGQANAKLTLKGTISGADGTLEAQGNLELEGENSYAGLDLKSNKVVAKGNQTVKTLVGDLASELEIALGRTFTIDGVTGGPGSVHKGGISGQGMFEIFKGLAILEGESSNTISTIIGELGELKIGNETAAGAIRGNIHIQDQGKLWFNRPDDDVGYAIPGVITGSGKLINERGFTILDGANGDFTGEIEVRGGVLGARSNNAFGKGPINANGHAVVAVMNASVSNPITLAAGSTIAGHGRFGSAIIGHGVTLAPGLNNGHPIGNLGFEDLTLGGGGILDWNLRNPHGEAGDEWDLVTVNSSSTLTITATAMERFTLKLSTVGSGGQSEVIGDFAEGTTYQWLLFETQGIAGFDPDAFAFDTTDFLTNAPGGEFWISTSDNELDLFLNFTPVPEPSTYALILTGLGMSGLAAWRRRRLRSDL